MKKVTFAFNQLEIFIHVDTYVTLSCRSLFYTILHYFITILHYCVKIIPFFCNKHFIRYWKELKGAE